MGDEAVVVAEAVMAGAGWPAGVELAAVASPERPERPERLEPLERLEAMGVQQVDKT
jgi:hypothetical protein